MALAFVLPTRLFLSVALGVPGGSSQGHLCLRTGGGGSDKQKKKHLGFHSILGGKKNLKKMWIKFLKKLVLNNWTTARASWGVLALGALGVPGAPCTGSNWKVAESDVAFFWWGFASLAGILPEINTLDACLLRHTLFTPAWGECFGLQVLCCKIQITTSCPI